MLCLLFAAAPLRADYIIFANDKPGWIAAAGGVPYLIEDFNDDTLNAGLSYSGSGVIDSQVWRDWVAPGEGFGNWYFDTPITGVGANWDLTPAGAGVGIRITLIYSDYSEEVLPIEIPNTASGMFVGLFSDKPIIQIRYTGGSQVYSGNTDHSEESFTMDDLVYIPFGAGGNGGPIGEVPEPSTWLLSGAALAALAWRSRRLN